MGVSTYYDVSEKGTRKESFDVRVAKISWRERLPRANTPRTSLGIFLPLVPKFSLWQKSFLPARRHSAKATTASQPLFTRDQCSTNMAAEKRSFEGAEAKSSKKARVSKKDATGTSTASTKNELNEDFIGFDDSKVPKGKPPRKAAKPDGKTEAYLSGGKFRHKTQYLRRASR